MPPSAEDDSALPLFPDRPPGDSAARLAPITYDEARDAINQLFHRAMKHSDPGQWMKGLLTFVAGMRRYSIFNTKLIQAQRPGAAAVDGKPRRT